ncbi:MAG: 50S ribosomal protein L15 [Planctomycetes bacterium]|nr:50S ribosomal protein L15 [Planctomycetota bacterium]
MDLKIIKKTETSREKSTRVGRGLGSGLGKTCGRGMNGQGSRSGTGGKLGFEGGQMPIYRRLPKKGFTNDRFKVIYSTINIRDLGGFQDGDPVDLAAAKTHKLVKENATNLKILGSGDLKIKLKVKANKFSASARQKIEAAGGTVEEIR